jgi:hypothetical protein
MTQEEEFEFRLRLEAELAQTSEPAQPAAPKRSVADEASLKGNDILQRSLNYDATDARGGLARGAGSIGATLLAPIDALARAANGGKPINIGGYDIAGHDRRAGMDAGLQSLGVNTDSTQFKTNKLIGEVAGTSGVGGALAKGAQAAGAGPSMVSALRTGGLDVAGRAGVGGLATRALGGATTGAATAGLVDPAQAGEGALIGAAIPVAAKVGSGALQSVGRSLRGGVIAPEVASLAKRAEQLGIQVPADRIANSKPLNALAASLEYVPLSGRAATNERMVKQLNTAVSRTFGQDTDNVTMGLRKASHSLGGEFDRVLKQNSVAVDKQLFDEMAEHANQASRELGSDGARIIQNQIDEIFAKGQTGQMDGQAAYNIKKTLDRIGRRNSPEAHYAIDLKKSLMEALNRSLGPDEAAAFARTRQQYGNMLSLEKIAKNGAEGEISIARLANMKNIKSPDLQELADISAQFLKGRESNHGALQRLVIGGTALGAGSSLGALPIAAGTVAAGRAANSILNSGMARRGLLASPAPAGVVSDGLLGVTRVAPLLTGPFSGQ